MLAEHRRVTARGEDQVEPTHWAGLPEGTTRAVSTHPDDPPAPTPPAAAAQSRFAVVLAHPNTLATPVVHRDQAIYDTAAGLTSAGGRR